jgi:anti-sigma-K factor RskA
MQIERELERVLRRQDPPAGFADRVMKRVASEGSARPRRTFWRAAAASVALTAVLAGWSGYKVAERRRIEGERAREEVLTALRIASEKVRYAQEEVRSIGANESKE